MSAAVDCWTSEVEELDAPVIFYPVEEPINTQPESVVLRSRCLCKKFTFM